MKFEPGGGGKGPLEWQEGVSGSSWTHKSTLITYFSGMKINPEYRTHFCMPKTHLFSYFVRFCSPKRCTRVHCLVLKNNPNYVNLWTSLIPPLTFEWPPRVWTYFAYIFCLPFAKNIWSLCYELHWSTCPIFRFGISGIATFFYFTKC